MKLPRDRIARNAFMGMMGMLVSAAAVPRAWAQSPAGPSPGSPPPGLPGAVPSAPGGDGHAWLAFALLVVGLMVVLAAAAKIVDLKNRRQGDAMQLQAQISNALLQDRTLGDLPVVPTAHVPTLKGSPATVEISGRVPNPELRQAAVRLVEAEASRARPDVRIEDHLEVVRERRAA